MWGILVPAGSRPLDEYLFIIIVSEVKFYILTGTDMKLILHDIMKYKISCLVSLPTWTNLVFSNLGDTTLPWMKHVVCGGDLVSDALLQRIATGSPNAQCLNLYGPTETTVFCMAYSCDPKTTKGPLPIGTPISGAYMYPQCFSRFVSFFDKQKVLVEREAATS